jgi:hypothetical protein
MPGGTLDGARKAGPLGFLPNSCTWSSRIALGHVVLGDAAGALDPTQGLGTSLLFRDVRALSDLLTADRDRERATSEFARQRQAYYEVLRAYDRWCALLDSEEGPEADRRRELNASARERDPALGGFAASKPAARTGWYRMKRRVGSTSASRASMRVDECPIGAPSRGAGECLGGSATSVMSGHNSARRRSIRKAVTARTSTAAPCRCRPDLTGDVQPCARWSRQPHEDGRVTSGWYDLWIRGRSTDKSVPRGYWTTPSGPASETTQARDMGG